MASQSAEEIDDQTVTHGTGNVFVDLGYADAEERQTKLRLSVSAMKRSQVAAIAAFSAAPSALTRIHRHSFFAIRASLQNPAFSRVGDIRRSRT